MSAGVPTHVIHNPTQLTLSSQEKSRLKEWIQNQARHFRATYFTENSSTSNIALEIIRRLASAVDLLQVGKDHKDNTKALSDIANILAKGDVSPFEMVHSGLITKLFQYLTDDISIPNNRLERLKLFLHIFTSVPYENQSDHEKDLKEYIIELRQTHMHQEKPTQNVLSHLTSKLHGCINQLEQFPIRGKTLRWWTLNTVHLTSFPVNDTTGRPVPTSALRLISTHQLKCHLARHPQCKTLKQWNSGPVKIDPFALVSALEKYLLLRGIASGGMVSLPSANRKVTVLTLMNFQEDPSGTIDDEDSEVSNESDAEDIINVLAHASTMRLEFLINDHVIPNNMTLFQAVRMYSTATQRTTYVPRKTNQCHAELSACFLSVMENQRQTPMTRPCRRQRFGHVCTPSIIVK